MTEQQEPAADQTQVPELEIPFAGRTLWVTMPSPEQLLVWRRTLRQLQKVDVKSWSAEQVMTALERARKIIDSLLVNKADVTWLDDEMLEGRVTLMNAAEIINTTAAAFAEAAEREGNRETRRAAKKTPAKKAARKKESPAA